MKTYIQRILLVICALTCFISIRQCNTYKQLLNTSERNIKALNDTIRNYRTKNGYLVSTKLLLEGDLKDMKTLNESLYEEISDLKIKGTKQAIVINTVAELPLTDTCWVVQHDTISNEVNKDFLFSDEWHTLLGNVTYKNDTLGLNVYKNTVNLDYDVIIDKNNRVHIATKNPYVNITDINGFTIPKQKRKRFGIGVQAGYGYDIRKSALSPYVGVGISYNLVTF